MLEPIENQYVLIGHIARSHGVEGVVLIIPEIYSRKLFDALELVRIQDERGDLIPARIKSVRVQEKNSRLSFFVKFEHVTDRTEAEKLKDFGVYVDSKLVEHLLDDKSEDETPIDFTTFEIWSNGEYLGSIEETINNPAHPILQVTTGNQKQLLIPLVDEYISSISENDRQIHCRNLEQLEDLT